MAKEIEFIALPFPLPDASRAALARLGELACKARVEAGPRTIQTIDYVTPVTRLEFLLGNQLPYMVAAMISFVLLLIQSQLVFHVPIKGSLLALSVATLLYVIVTTGFGLLVSTFTSTQIAALFGTAIMSMLPTVSFSGLTSPVSSLEGAGYWIGQFFPATYFLVICRGIFTKALDFGDLLPHFIKLAALIPVLTLLAVLLLRKQER